LGLVNEAFRPANTAAMAAYSDETNRMRSFSLMRLSFNLGWAVGGGVGGFLASYSYQYLFWIDGLTNVFAALLIYLLLFPISNKSSITEKDTSQNLSVYKDHVFIIFAFVSILYIISFFQMLSNLTAYFKNVVQLTERVIGLLMMWNGILIVLVEMSLVYYLERKWSKRNALLLGVFFHLIAYLILIVFEVDLWIAFTCITFITLSEMFAFPVLVSFWISRSNAANRGQYAGIWTMTWSIAQSVGTITGASIAQYFGFSALWWTVIIFCAVSMMFYSKLIKN
jgi:predicted MFS family arabinose efflux permease